MSKQKLLYEYQFRAAEKMRNGCILNGGVGSGKSRTGIFYYYSKNGGSYDQQTDKLTSMRKKPQDLYIITTAKKRDDCEFEKELAYFAISTNPDATQYKHKVIIDSWNNIKKYAGIEGAFFIFDEDRVTGKGAWVKSFYKIAKANKWIILSATPGDTWEQYIPVFVANGFYKNKTEFSRNHIVYSRYTNFPKIDRYIGTGRLIRLRNRILIDMDYERPTTQHHIDEFVDYNPLEYKKIFKTRWDPFKDEPIAQASGLCYVLRRVINSDESRQVRLLEILEKTQKAIIFYNFDYELEIIKQIVSLGPLGKESDISEWNGHKHQEIPKSDRWVYLVQYNAGCEGWNCIETNTIIFFSQSYSYKMTAQASGRIDRLNTKYLDLYYYHFKCRAGIDLAISKALSEKKTFNETRWINKRS